ncbi:MAG: tyrosine-type recombinase/integrase [Alsobacter sp.]
MTNDFTTKIVRRGGREYVYIRVRHTVAGKTAEKTYLDTPKGRAAAVRWKKEQIAAEANDGFVTGKTPPLADFFEAWIVSKRTNGLRAVTERTYRDDFDRHLRDQLGHRRLRDITHSMLQARLDEMGRAGLSPATRRKTRTLMTGLLKAARKADLIKARPEEDLEIGAAPPVAPKPDAEGWVLVHEDERAAKCPTPAEADAILLAAKGGYARALLATLIYTGMRASEARALRWRNVDLDAGVIHVVERAGRAQDIDRPKSNAGRREIPLAAVAIAVLSQWRAERVAPGPDDRVFATSKGRVPSHSNLASRIFGPAQVRAGVTLTRTYRHVQTGQTRTEIVPRFGLHALRHLSLSKLAGVVGGNMKQVSTVAGHSDTRTTEIYRHNLADLAEMRRLMDRAHGSGEKAGETIRINRE